MKKKHSIFAVTAALMLAMFGCSNSSQGQTGVKNINQEEYKSIVAREKPIIIDVRTPGEVSQGYIKGTTVFADINSSGFAGQIEGLDKSKKYIVYCRSGARSSSAANYMIGKGFKHVYNLSGGISNWTGDITKPQ